MKLLRNLINRYKNIRACLKHPGRFNSRTYRKYAPDCTFEGKKVLNLGCGTTTYKAPNVVNLDMFPGEGINVVWDLSKTPLPFEDQTFDLIVANHILEHIPGWWECFKDLARIVKIGGVIEVWIPGDGGSSQLGYRDHINVINFCSFTGVRGTCRNQANSWEINDRLNLGYVRDLAYCKDAQIIIPNWWWLYILPKKTVEFMTFHLRNVVTEVGYFFKRLPPEGEGK